MSRGVVGLRLSREERETVEAAAAQRGATLSTFLRSVGLEEARRVVNQTSEAPEAPAPVAERDLPTRQLPRREAATLRRVFIDGLWVEVELPAGSRIIDGELLLPKP